MASETKTNINVKPKRPICKNIRDYFREYCGCSSIHGFRYFGEKRTYFERGWWFVVFSLTLSACIFLIYQVYLKWEQSPVIVSFSTYETPIYKIPFPAVTICPESKSIQPIYNHTLMLQKKRQNESLTEEDAKRFEYMSLICNSNDIDQQFLNSNSNETFTNDFFKELEYMSDFFPPPILECKYLNVILPCTELFTRIITDEGVCFTFNMLDRSEIFENIVNQYSNFHSIDPKSLHNWSIDNGYHKNAGLNPYPRRALLAGANNALVVNLITAKINIDYTCKESQQGFRVTLHTPMRVPRPSQQYFRVPLNQVVIGAIQPVMITTSESVKMYPPKKRECFFPHERPLKFFKIYTQLNCKLECLTNYTLNSCGCVNFFMPRDNLTEVCGGANLECMKDAENNLQMRDLFKKLHKPLKLKRKAKKRRVVEECNCMPICNDLTYDVETSQSSWDWYEMIRAQNNGSLEFEQDEFHLSQLILYFKGTQFVTSQRHELFGPTDFLANFGGLLGLFTGFSVLSFMEIIYFLTVRLFCNHRLYGNYAGQST